MSVSGQLDQRSHDPCIACGCGDNSISHWSRFCIVPLLVFNYFCAETHAYVNLAQAVNADDHVIAVASVVLRQFRRLLLERGGMVHSQEARDLVKWDTQNWIDTWENLSTKLSLLTCAVVHGINFMHCLPAGRLNAVNMLVFYSASIRTPCILWR